jgi:hypothetical protein
VSEIVQATQLVLAFVLTNAGGEGKSTWAEILAALARLAGLDVIVADVDPGNRGYLNRNGDGSALSLDWSPTGTDAKALPDPTSWFAEHLAGRRLAILDTGANMLAARNPINEFIGGLIEAARRKNAKIVVFGVTSPNKAGSDELIEMMYHRFRRGAEVVVVQNDRDGSRSFKPSIAALGTPIINLPHLDPGLQAVRLRRCIPLDDVLTNPEPGFERATALIAKQLRQVAPQAAVAELIGSAATDPLNALASAAPAETLYRILDLERASNTSLDLNQKAAEAWRQFRASKKHSPEFMDASVTLWDAEHAWNSRPR